MVRSGLATLVCFLGLLAMNAKATPTFEFAANVQTGVPTNADAVFTIDVNSFIITLTNTGGPGQVQDIGSELAGLTFTTAGGSPVFDDSSLSGSAPGAVNCTGVSSGASCPSTALPASPYGWQFSGTSTFSLLAGNGSYKPFDIVNTNLVVEDGVANHNHNPLLVGPVTFAVNFTGLAPTSITSAAFYFGTTPTIVDGVVCNTCDRTNTQGAVPEPMTFLLTGTALISIGFLQRHRLSRSKTQTPGEL